MFATLRAEEKDGEVICISSTNRPPQPGQHQNHFACDGCRAKKLKCTGHRFGCQRCRDRNLVCTYNNVSQSKRRRAKRLSSPFIKSSSQEVLTLSSSNDDGLKHQTPPQQQDTIVATEIQSSIQAHTLSEDARTNGRPSPQPLASGDSLAPPSNSQTLLNPDDSPLPASTEEQADLPVAYPGLHLLHCDEPDFNDFSMDELLDVELLSDQEPIDYPSSGAFSSTSPEGKGESRESSFSASGSSSSIEWDATQQSNRDRHGDFLHSPLIPLKRASTSAMSPSLALHLAPFPPDFESITNSPGAPATRQSPSRQTVQPSPRKADSKGASSCCCIAVTLTHLEKIQSHARVSSLCLAEKTLYTLKRSILQCLALPNCRTCRSPSRVMTFLVLLVEKMTVMLEDIASTWETSLAATEAQHNASQMDTYGNAHHWLPVRLGQYQIDSVAERCEVLGFLILLQTRQLAGFVDSLQIHAAREGWESQRSALRPAFLRVRDLQESLGSLALRSRGDRAWISTMHDH